MKKCDGAPLVVSPISLPDRLIAAIRSDDDDERRRQEMEAETEAEEQREWQTYLRMLVEMPFEKRVHAIVNDQSIKRVRFSEEWEEWDLELSRCRDEEIDALDAGSTQSLIDLCENNYVVKWPDVLRRLYDRRHHLRQAAMDGIRQAYASMSPRDQLTELVINSVAPMEHFPVELALEVTNEWLQKRPCRTENAIPGSPRGLQSFAYGPRHARDYPREVCLRGLKPRDPHVRVNAAAGPEYCSHSQPRSTL